MDFEDGFYARNFGLEAAGEERSLMRDYDTLLRAREIIDEILSPRQSTRDLNEKTEDGMVLRGGMDIEVTVRYPAQRMGWVWEFNLNDSPTFGDIKANIIHYFGSRRVTLEKSQMELWYNGAKRADSASLFSAPYRTGDEIEVRFPAGGPPRPTPSSGPASARATTAAGNKGTARSSKKQGAVKKVKEAGGKRNGHAGKAKGVKK